MKTNDYSTISNQLTSALGNEFANNNIQLSNQTGILGLRQLANFNMTQSFQDSDGKQC